MDAGGALDARAGATARDRRLATTGRHLRPRPRHQFKCAFARLPRRAASLARSSASGEDDDEGEGLIEMIVTDVDGTLLNSKQKLSVKTASALQRAARLGVRTVVATGKTRGPWARDLYSKLGRENRQMPGLFIQGLVTCDENIVKRRLWK